MSETSARLVAVGRKLPQYQTQYITYATKDPAWHPQKDVRADPDITLDIDDMLKERSESYDPEDMTW